jgi:hypothetical protein
MESEKLYPQMLWQIKQPVRDGIWSAISPPTRVDAMRWITLREVLLEQLGEDLGGE